MNNIRFSIATLFLALALWAVPNVAQAQETCTYEVTEVNNIAYGVGSEVPFIWITNGSCPAYTLKLSLDPQDSTTMESVSTFPDGRASCTLLDHSAICNVEANPSGETRTALLLEARVRESGKYTWRWEVPEQNLSGFWQWWAYYINYMPTILSGQPSQ